MSNLSNYFDQLDEDALYIVVTWPEIQELMDIEGFEDNCHLINDAHGYDEYGSSAYFVRVKWLAEKLEDTLEE